MKQYQGLLNNLLGTPGNDYMLDLFCGAGGTTTGAHAAGIKVFACVNHDELAIASHQANHPNCIHFIEDIRKVSMKALKWLVDYIRDNDKYARIHIWASLECTHHSGARGGKPRDADSRTLGNDLFPYLEWLDPDVLWIENVREWMSWGPLNDQGKPVHRLKGADYIAWVNRIQDYGYRYDWKMLNSADFGAYTSRKRFFAQCVKNGLSWAWPQPTHSKNGTGAQKWKPVREVLDFSQTGKSIFDRKKPLSTNTMARIYAGLVKYVAGGSEAFLLKYNSKNQKGHHLPPSIDDPCPVVAAQNRLELVSFISTFHGNGHNMHPVDGAAPTVPAADTLAVVNACWMDKSYSGPANHQSIDAPAGTITTKDKLSIVSTEWIDRNFSGGGKHSSVDTPAGTITTVPKMNLVQTRFIMDPQYKNLPASVDEPARTMTANRKYHYLVNPQFASKGGDVNQPCFTLIARMDKAPPHLITTEEGLIAIRILDTDCENTRKVKLFMAHYGIADIKMRMLFVSELLQIQGFGKDYVLKGAQEFQKKFIGNSVEVNTARALLQNWCESNPVKKWRVA